MDVWSPEIQLSFLTTARGQVAVVRDDLLKGGTKQRAAIPYLQTYLREGVKEFIYASPFSGYAQIALAVSCNAVGAKCTIFAERQNGAASAFTQSIASTANIRLYDNLNYAETAAAMYAGFNPHRLKVPLGFNHPLFKYYLKEELRIQWGLLCKMLGFVPRHLWVPVGSGTLAEIFRGIVPPTTKITCVDVRVLPQTDQRILKIKKMQNIEYAITPEQFCQPVRLPPPIPSNMYYDAKIWQFIVTEAMGGDVWWNVAC